MPDMSWHVTQLTARRISTLESAWVLSLVSTSCLKRSSMGKEKSMRAMSYFQAPRWSQLVSQCNRVSGISSLQRKTDITSRYGASAQLVMTVKGGTVNGFTMVGSFSTNTGWCQLRPDILGQCTRRIHTHTSEHAYPKKASHIQCQRGQYHVLGRED